MRNLNKAWFLITKTINFLGSYISMNTGKLLSSQETLMRSNTKNSISTLIEECNNESDIDKKIQLFYKIHSMLPEQYQPNIPSLITDDYIDTMLYRIHQNMKIDMVNR
jgi:predicted DNA-binding protein (UPF0278 family)